MYSGDDAGTERGRAAIRALDDRIAAKEEQMSQIVQQPSERPTQLLAQTPELVPEPYPPPDEGTPPTPAPVPEPYPPPDEGDPPQPQ